MKNEFLTLALVNDPAMTGLAREAAEEIVGADTMPLPPHEKKPRRRPSPAFGGAPVAPLRLRELITGDSLIRRKCSPKREVMELWQKSSLNRKVMGPWQKAQEHSASVVH